METNTQYYYFWISLSISKLATFKYKKEYKSSCNEFCQVSGVLKCIFQHMRILLSLVTSTLPLNGLCVRYFSFWVIRYISSSTFCRRYIILFRHQKAIINLDLLQSELRKELKKGGKPSPSNDGLAQVGEDSALEEILPQIDDLTSRSTEFQRKITELEIQMKRPIKDTAIDAVVELTANLKQDFAQFRSDTDEAINNFEKIKNIASMSEKRIGDLEDQYRAKQITLDTIVQIVERTEQQSHSQSSKLQLLEDAIRETKSKLANSDAISSDALSTTHFDQSQFELHLRDEIKKLEEKIEQVKNISCSLIEDVSENQKEELQTVQENLHEMIISIEDKMMDNTMNMSAGSSSENISSELLNQQLAEVRLDKNILMERLNIAETARFELQKVVDHLRETLSKNRELSESHYDQQKKILTDLRIEMDGWKDQEIVRKTISEEKDVKLGATLKSFEHDREKVHQELIGIVEREVNSKKALNKVHGQIDELDEQICQLVSDRQHNVDSLSQLRNSIMELEKLLQEQMTADIEQGQKIEGQIADLVNAKNGILLKNEQTGMLLVTLHSFECCF